MPDPTVPAPVPASGFKSSEFWTMAISTLGGFAGIVAGAIPAQYAPLLAVAPSVYIVARNVLKALHQVGYMKQIPDLPELPAGVVRQTVTEIGAPKP